MQRFKRKYNTINQKNIIHIFTEGEKTEPDYFNSIKDDLRLNEIDIKIYGKGDHTMSLVESVIKIKNESKNCNGDEWWVVFDRDNHLGFNQAIEIAEKNKIYAVYSNECFELWFILHFEFLNTSIGREAYYDKLTNLFGNKYDKKKSVNYEILKCKESDAIRNAKKLDKIYEDQGVTSCEKRDPSTQVYKLVERLRVLKSQ